MDKYKKSVLDKLDSILLFSGDDKTFKLGEWKAWRGACEKEGKLLDPELFKKRTK